MGGAAASNHSAAPPNRAVGAALAKLRDCIDDRISNGRRNETRSLSLMSPAAVDPHVVRNRVIQKYQFGSWVHRAILTDSSFPHGHACVPCDG